MAKEEMRRLNEEEGKKVVVLDAAVLLRANWHKDMCHEVSFTVKPAYGSSLNDETLQYPHPMRIDVHRTVDFSLNVASALIIL